MRAAAASSAIPAANATANQWLSRTVAQHGWGVDDVAWSSCLVLAGRVDLCRRAPLGGVALRPAADCRPADRPAAEPPVSVLKPLHGAEPGLGENLRSFADQDYPRFPDRARGARPRRRGAADRARADRATGRGATSSWSSIRGPPAAISRSRTSKTCCRRRGHDLIVLADSDMRVTPRLSRASSPRRWPTRAIGVVTCLYKARAERRAVVAPGGAAHQFRLSAERAGRRGAGRRRRLLRRDDRAAPRGAGADRRVRPGAQRTGRRPPASASAVRELGLATVLSPLCRREPRQRAELRRACGGTSCAGRAPSRAMAPVGFAGSVVTHTVVAAGAGRRGRAGSAAAGLVAGAAVAAAALGVGGGDRRARSTCRATGCGCCRCGMFCPSRCFSRSFCGRSVSWRDQLFRVEPSGRMSVEGDEPV